MILTKDKFYGARYAVATWAEAGSPDVYYCSNLEEAQEVAEYAQNAGREWEINKVA